MNLLAVSTSGPIPAAALLRDGDLIDSRSHKSGQTHSETLMPLLDDLLCANGLSPQDIDLYAADVGPGSFTGVRIGVCAANAMAFAGQKNVIGVSSLEALCRGHRGPVCALLDARNGNGYAMYQNDFGIIVPPSAVVVSVFLPKLMPFTLILGDGAQVYRDRILSTVPCACFSGVRDEVDAQDVVLAAWEKYISGDLGTPEVKPLYLRPSQAERLYKEK